MLFKIFNKKKISIPFLEDEWTFDENTKKYKLSIEIDREVKSCTKILLYKSEGSCYIFMSEGFETIVKNLIIYFSLFPFSGKIVLK